VGSTAPQTFRIAGVAGVAGVAAVVPGWLKSVRE